MSSGLAMQIAGFVLAGGQSSRMAKDKALVLFNGIPLVQQSLNVLSASLACSATPALRIAGARSDLSSFAPTIVDIWTDVGPLGGIHAALLSSEAEWNLFLPVDMPLIPPSLLKGMIMRVRTSNAPVTALKVNGHIEPYPVLLHRSTLPHLIMRLKEGRTAGHQAWNTIPLELNQCLDAPSVESLIQARQLKSDQEDDVCLPPSFWFMSANTPHELARLNRLFQQGSRRSDPSIHKVDSKCRVVY